MKCLHGCIKHLKQTQDVNQNNRRTVNHGIYVAGIQTCSAFFISLTSSTMIPTTRVSQHKLSSRLRQGRRTPPPPLRTLKMRRREYHGRNHLAIVRGTLRPPRHSPLLVYNYLIVQTVYFNTKVLLSRSNV
ncbi:unnamed protein product [Urochloa humidicola]